MSVRKLVGMLFLVNGLQFLIGAGILLGLLTNIIDFSEVFVELSVSLVLLSSVLTIAGLFSILRFRDKSYRESMRNMESLNMKLREQRHDYLNQIQIVSGLLELGEFEEARDYLKPVFKDIMKVNRALRTAQPAVNALLRAKMEAAEEKQIDFYLEVSTQLKELPMEPWEFCKLLGNLIDNAVTAAGQTDETMGAAGQTDETMGAAGQTDETMGVAGQTDDMMGATGQADDTVTGTGQRDRERWIRLQMLENPVEYRLSIQNNGPEIPKSQRKIIFNQGFTTKKGEGHGMGLAIVSSILKEAGGSITLESGPEGTEFLVTLPRQPKTVNRKIRQIRAENV